MLKSLKTLALISAILISGLVAIQAQDEDLSIREQRQQFRTERREKMTQFHNEEVVPILKKMKAKLDKSMSAEDLETLNDLRSQAAKLREEHRAERDKFREMVASNPDSCFCNERKEHRAKAEAHRAEMNKLFDKLEPLAEKYEKSLSLLYEEFEVEFKNIREKRQELRSDFRKGTRQEFRKNGRRGGRGHGQGHGYGRGNNGRRFDRGNGFGNGDCEMMLHNPERFLLWDGSLIKK